MTLDISAFCKQLRYVSKEPSSIVLADLNAIARLDQHAQKQKKKFSVIGWISGLGAFALIFVTAVVAENAPVFAPIGVAAIGLGFLTTIVCAIVYHHWNRLDCPDVRHQLPQKLLNILGRDMAKGASTDLAIDFSSPTQTRKKTRTGPHPYRRGWKRDYFEDGWLTIQGEFLDGTTYTLKANELWIRSHGWKRSRSGKSKHKSKIKPKGLELDLFLQFSRKRYGAVSLLKADITDAIKLPQGAQLKKIQVADNKLGMRVKLSPSGRSGFHSRSVGDTATCMFLSVYHVLNLAQKLSKSAT